MEFILYIILSNSVSDNIFVDSQTFASRTACMAARQVIRDKIVDEHGIGNMTFICIPKSDHSESPS